MTSSVALAHIFHESFSGRHDTGRFHVIRAVVQQMAAQPQPVVLIVASTVELPAVQAAAAPAGPPFVAVVAQVAAG